MYLVIKHINGEIDSHPFIVNDSQIINFKNGEYLIYSLDFMFWQVVENCNVEVLKPIKD